MNMNMNMMGAYNNKTGLSSQVNRWDGRCSICKKSTPERFVQVNGRVAYGARICESPGHT
jgi:hypothetical protein